MRPAPALTATPPHPRLDCELARMLALSPTARQQPPPTPAEVRRLFALTETAIRNLPETRSLAITATVVRLLKLHLEREGEAARVELLQRVAEQLLHALGLRGSSFGDAIEEHLGHAGGPARAGRSLAWLAEQLLPLVRSLALPGASGLSGAAIVAGPLASSVVDRLGLPRLEGAALDEQRRKVDHAIVATLRRRAPDVSGDLLDALRTNPALLAAVSRDVVVAVAKACGYERASERLFGADRKRRARRRHG